MRFAKARTVQHTELFFCSLFFFLCLCRVVETVSPRRIHATRPYSLAKASQAVQAQLARAHHKLPRLVDPNCVHFRIELALFEQIRRVKSIRVPPVRIIENIEAVTWLHPKCAVLRYAPLTWRVAPLPSEAPVHHRDARLRRRVRVMELILCLSCNCTMSMSLCLSMMMRPVWRYLRVRVSETRVQVLAVGDGVGGFPRSSLKIAFTRERRRFVLISLNLLSLYANVCLLFAILMNTMH